MMKHYYLPLVDVFLQTKASDAAKAGKKK